MLSVAEERQYSPGTAASGKHAPETGGLTMTLSARSRGRIGLSLAFGVQIGRAGLCDDAPRLARARSHVRRPFPRRPCSHRQRADRPDVGELRLDECSTPTP